MSDIDQAKELHEQAQSMPKASTQKVALLQAAARHAEAAEDEVLCYDIRQELIGSGLDAGQVEVSLAAFSWCLALCDEKPEKFPESDLHWRFKWMLEWAPRFAEVSRAQIDDLLADVTRRFKLRGIGANAVAKLQIRRALYLCDDAAVEQWFKTWRLSTRDTLSDCRACDKDEEVAVLLRLDRADEALEATRRLLRSGVTCAEVPDVTYARSLPALLLTGAVEEAEDWHRRGYARLKRFKRKLIACYGQHLLYTAVVGDLGRGLRILKEGLPLVADHPVKASQLEFLLGAELLLERIARGQASVRLALPTELGGSAKLATHATADLSGMLGARATAIAQEFDVRNGNRGVSKQNEEWRSFRELSLERPIRA